jgi:hypothetical protein
VNKVSSFLLCIQIQVPVEFRRHSTYIQINFPNIINTELNVVFSFMFSGTGTARILVPVSRGLWRSRQRSGRDYNYRFWPVSHPWWGALLRSMRHDFNVPYINVPYINRSIYQKKNLNCRPILNNICSPDQLLHTSIYYWSIGNCVTNLLYRSINVVNYRAKLYYIWFKVQLNYNWTSASFSNSFVP